MSENSGGTSSVCKHCGATLPTAIAYFCGNCGKPQQEIKSCIRCNFLLPAKAVFCFECGQNQSEQLQRKPCMLCKTVLPINAQHCILCSAPQDFGILRTLTLKNCNNQQCLVLMMPELQICYKCRAPQQVMPVVHNQSQQSGESVPLPPQYPEVLIQTATPLPSVTPPMNPLLQQLALQLSPIASLTDNEKEQYSTTFAHTTATNSPRYSPSLMDTEEDPSQKLNTSPITSHMTPTSSEAVTPQKALLSSPIKRSSDNNDYAPERKKKKTDKNTSVGTCEETNVFKEKGVAVVRQKLSNSNNETNDSGGSEPLKDPTNGICGDESNNTSSVPSGQENTQAHAHTDVLNREKAEAQRKFIKEKISESYVTSEEHGIMTGEERTETQDQNLERKRKQEETECDLIPSSKNIKNTESVNSYTPDHPDPPDNLPSDPPDTLPSDPQYTPSSDPQDTPPSDPSPSDPSPPPDPNISDQREEVPDPLSTPEIDPQTNYQVTQIPEDNVDPTDPNSSTFIAQASDSDSSPMPSPNKQDLKTPVQEVNDTNELHLGPNTTASQTSEVEQHNDEKKTKEIKMKNGDEQKKEKQNSAVQPTKVKDDQGNTSKGKEKKGLLSQKKEMK